MSSHTPGPWEITENIAGGTTIWAETEMIGIPVQLRDGPDDTWPRPLPDLLTEGGEA